MAEIGRWNGLKFEVKSGLVRGFTGLTIKGAVETEDKEKNSIKYVANKARKPTEVSLTVHLDARTGADVRDTAMKLVEKATYGAEDYFYIASKKLVPYKMKLVTADVSEILMTNTGKWICCDVKMSMKQSSLLDGSTDSQPTGGVGTQKYTVQIPGMSVLTIYATSALAAAVKACGSTYSGIVYVNNKAHYLSKGKFDDARAKAPATQQKTFAKKVIDEGKNLLDKAKTTINNIFNTVRATTTSGKTTTKTTKATTIKATVAAKKGPVALLK